MPIIQWDNREMKLNCRYKQETGDPFGPILTNRHVIDHRE